MTDDNRPLYWHVLEDAEAVAQEAARRALAAAEQAIDRRGRFRIVLAGGSTPERAYRLLAGAQADWGRWQVYFGDERCLPADHPQRNSVMAARAWLSFVPIPAVEIHSIPAQLGAEPAALAYRAVVEQALPFDLVLLGMGEDGHTASLFPGHDHSAGEWVQAVHHAPKPPPDRVSLGRAALSAADRVCFLVTGSGKREAVRRWRAGEPLPVAQVRGRSRTDVLIDRAAFGEPLSCSEAEQDSDEA
jgi:6-phosphogluconolactonase